jgi:hypothetical protein
MFLCIQTFCQDSERERIQKGDSMVYSLAIAYMKRQLGVKFY